MFRTVGDRPPLWESLLPAEVLRLPAELARVDALLDDPAFFAPFAPYFHPVIGRPSTPVECYLRLMFLKYRYRLGFESLCAEVSDSISWRRFCRILLDAKVPHPTTLMKLTTRCWETAVAGLNEALLAKAAGAKLLRAARVRTGTTTPGRSARAASTVTSSSATRPRSPTTTTASSWTTPWNTAPPPTARSWRPPWSGSPARPAGCPARSPPTGATASQPLSVTFATSASGPWRSPARQQPCRPARPSSTPAASASWSSGERGAKAGSATSNAATVGPHPPGRQGGSSRLVRTRGIRPQPGHDQRPGELNRTPGPGVCRRPIVSNSAFRLFQVEVS